MTTESEVSRVFAAQREHQWVTRTSTAEERKQRLARLREVVLAHKEEVAEALHADMGRPLDQGGLEVDSIVHTIDQALANLDDWMAPTPVTDLIMSSAAHIRYEARGTVLLFTPWNFPISLLFDPLVPIIAAGNTAIVKTNEFTPAASAVARVIIGKAFDEREVAVFEGGVDVAEMLLELPFDHIFLTGSPQVGRRVMAAAAKHLSSVTLELGGKSPLLIDETADLDAAIPQIAFGKILNGGQVCLSVDYVLVANSRKEEFIERLGQFLTNMLYADGKYQPERTSRIINQRGFERLKGYLDDAVSRGAKIVFGGHSDPDTLVIEPTILTDVPDDAPLMQNEIFGPILPIVGYDNADEALRRIRAGTKPLGLYVFSKDEAFIEKVLNGTSSGGVSVNSWGAHYLETNLPFGGVGDSGMGTYHGVYGFRELSHAKAVAFGAQ